MKPRTILCLLLAGAGSVLAAAPAPTAAPATATTAKPAASSTTAPVPAKPVAAPDNIIHIGGSDLLQTAIGEPLTRYVQQKHLAVKVDMAGSIPALSKLKTGEVQLAILDAPLGQAPAPKEFTAIPLCFAVDYIVVNQTNPINALDLREVAAVFGSTQRTAVDWGDLQAPPDWAAQPILACTTSTDDGLVLEIFKNEVLSGTAFLHTVHILGTAREMIKTVTDNPTAIGLSGFDPGPPCKVLLLSNSQSALKATNSSTTAAAKGAAQPTAQNIYTGDYPLRLPFYLVFKPADKARILDLLRLLLTDEYATNLANEHFVPVPNTERQRSSLELDNKQ